MNNDQSIQLATFFVDSIHFGVDILRVQEILRYQEMTPVPLASPEIAGLINLRGQILTAIDLRKRLDFPHRFEEKPPMNVIVRTADGTVSLIVDSVGDVLQLTPYQFEPTPSTLSPILQSVTTGVYKLKDSLLLVLDTEKAVNVRCNGYSKNRDQLNQFGGL